MDDRNGSRLSPEERVQALSGCGQSHRKIATVVPTTQETFQAIIRPIRQGTLGQIDLKDVASRTAGDPLRPFPRVRQQTVSEW